MPSAALLARSGPIAAVLVATFLLGIGGTTFGPVAPVPGAGPGLPGVAGPASTGPLEAAAASLATGAGPAAGGSWECSAAAALASTCARASVVGSPTQYGWVNLTGRVHPLPSPRALGVMTYDGATGYILFYGGEIAGANGTYGPQHDTWSFENGVWTNLTTHVAGGPPPDSAASSMAFDPALHEVILFGGQNRSGYIGGQTWTFTNNTWTNLTGTLSAQPSPREVAAFVYDSTDREMLLFGGENSSYDTETDTWTFTAAGWENLTSTVSDAPFGLVYPEMVNDPAEGGVLLYGIADPDHGAQALTWLFSNNSWSNLTASLVPAPPSMVLPAADYVAALNGVVMASSLSVSPGGTGFHFPQTWFFGGGAWRNLTADAPAPFGASEGSSSVDAAGVPWAFGGSSNGQSVDGDLYAFLPPLTGTLSAGTDPLDLGASESLTGSVVGALAPSTDSIAWGDGTYSNGSASATHTYATTGNFTAWLNATDMAGRRVSLNVTIDVRPALRLGAINVSTATPSTGTSVRFTASAAGGDPPFTYAWAFGDGSTATNASVAHTYARAGRFTVNVTVTDATGRSAMESYALNVSAASTGSTPPSWALEVGVLAVVLVAVAGAVIWSMRRRRAPPAAWSPPPIASPPIGAPPPPGAAGAPVGDPGPGPGAH